MLTLTRSRSKMHADALAKRQEPDLRRKRESTDSRLLGPEDFPSQVESFSEETSEGTSVHKHAYIASPTPEEGGLNIFTSMLFIIGECVGCGILALPHALSKTGWIGLGLIVFCACCSSYTGTMLGRCWYIILCNVPHLNRHCAAPYPQIGYECFGQPGRIIVTISVHAFLYGVCTAILIIAGENIQNLLAQLEIEVSSCYMGLVVGLILVPFCWFKSPKDFWPIALMAASTTALSSTFVIIQCWIDIPVGHNASANHQIKIDEGLEEEHKMTLFGFFMAFGIVLFSYGGMAIFPTIQADMREPQRFSTAVILSMMTIVVMYVAVAISGYYTYGNIVRDNILSSITPGPCMTIAIILSTCNLFAAFVITQNPISQLFEWFLGIEDRFCIQRAMARTMVTCWIIFTALSVPKFGVFLALVGGSTVTLNSFIFPSVFYMKLTSTHREWRHTQTEGFEYPILCFICLVGLIGGTSAVYSALQDILDPNSFTPPCYIHVPVADTSGSVAHANRYVRAVANISSGGVFP